MLYSDEIEIKLIEKLVYASIVEFKRIFKLW